MHPPFTERVREYAYLVTIALVALGIGVVALAFAGPTHGAPASAAPTGGPADQHGAPAPGSPDGQHSAPASGALAGGPADQHDASQADHGHPADNRPAGPASGTAPAGGVVGTLDAPAQIAPGQPATLTYRLADAATGAPIADVVESHERPMHLIAVSRDLRQFQHVHPDPTGTPGEYRVEVTFPEPGTYLLFDEFVRASGDDTILRDTLTVGAAGADPAHLSEDLAPKAAGPARVSLTGADAIRAGQEARLTFRLDDAATGRPLTDLAPYLGAPAHAVVLSEDAQAFAHTHGEAVASAGGPSAGATPQGMAGHGTTGHDAPAQPAAAASDDHAHGGGMFGPEIAVRHTFAAPGLYKLWGQFQTRDGQVVTADFVVRVAP